MITSTYNIIPNDNGQYSLGWTGGGSVGTGYAWNNIYCNTIWATSTVTAANFNATSDYRIKENIKPLDNKFKVDYLNPITYMNKQSKKQDIGLIAHELEEFYPELVTGEKDGVDLQSVNYIGLIPILINEIKVLKNKNIFLENEIIVIRNNHSNLENKNIYLENEIQNIKKLIEELYK
jgi:FtsZ-binding cell division protein ZapB